MKIKIPNGYCPTCSKQALDKVDLEIDATETINKLRRSIPVAAALGGAPAALAEVCFQLDTPMPVAGSRETLDKASAARLLEEIARRFGSMLVNFIMNSRMGEEILHHMRGREREEERYRRDREEMLRYSHTLPPTMLGVGLAGTESFTRSVPKEYYVPEYRVKENKR